MILGYVETIFFHTNPSEKQKRNIISVIKGLFGEHLTSRSVKTQKRIVV